MKTDLYFSVVIPTLNEEKYLPLLLEDLSKQTFFSDKFEVIVVDGQSEDQTTAQAEKYQSKLKLKILTTQKRNVSHQRNLGAKESQGEWILFMDADNRLPDKFLDGVKYQIVQNPKADLFTTWTAIEGKSALNRAIANVINLSIEAYQLIEKPSAIGAMIGCRKKIFSQVKFDEKQKFLEDGYFVQAAHKQGLNFVVFRDPRYMYSMRRLHKEGTLKYAGSVAILQLKYLQGKDFFKEHHLYPMAGGKYYESKSVPFLKQINSFLKTASQKQLQSAKKILSTLIENSD